MLDVNGINPSAVLYRICTIWLQVLKPDIAQVTSMTLRSQHANKDGFNSHKKSYMPIIMPGVRCLWYSLQEINVFMRSRKSHRPYTGNEDLCWMLSLCDNDVLLTCTDLELQYTWQKL